mgnify:CR=1 FL=1
MSTYIQVSVLNELELFITFAVQGKKCKKKNKMSSYINKEFKMLFKSPIFFMQCIYPTLIMIVTLIIILLFKANSAISKQKSTLFVAINKSDRKP